MSFTGRAGLAGRARRVSGRKQQRTAAHRAVLPTRFSFLKRRWTCPAEVESMTSRGMGFSWGVPPLGREPVGGHVEAEGPCTSRPSRPARRGFPHPQEPGRRLKTCSLLGLMAHSSPQQASAHLKGIKKASEPKFKHEPVGKCTLWKGIPSKELKAE